jgi:hypothetical protein
MEIWKQRNRRNGQLFAPVPNNKSLSLSQDIEESCTKLCKIFYSCADCGIQKHGFNSLNSKKIYESLVLPRALYGSELWN